MEYNTYLPDTRRSSTASSTLCLKVSSLANSNSNWAGESSNSMPVILLARDWGHMKKTAKYSDQDGKGRCIWYVLILSLAHCSYVVTFKLDENYTFHLTARITNERLKNLRLPLELQWLLHDTTNNEGVYH